MGGLLQNPVMHSEKLYDFRKFLAVKFVHRSIYSDQYTPEQLKCYFMLNVDIHNRELRDNLKIRVPLLKSALGQTCIHWYGGNYWNSLDFSIRSENDLCAFKKSLRNNVINTY